MYYTKFAKIGQRDTIFINIEKGQEKAKKRPNYFISGKLFQKRPN
jgi:hypothetical protein